MANKHMDGLERASRQSNFELMRLAAMLLIVFSHFSIHGGFLFPDGAVTANRLWLHAIQGGNLGLNLFLLLSGYFMVSSKGFKTVKLLRLWLQVLTYSLVIYGLFVAAGAVPLTYLYVLTRVLPVSYDQWWFASVYIVLLLLSPFLNRLLTGLERRDYRKLLAVTTVLWSVLPTLLPQVDLQSNDLLWGMYLYALAGYLRLHGDTSRLSRRSCFLLAVGIQCLLVLAAAAGDLAGQNYPLLTAIAGGLGGKQRLPTLLMSVFVFLGFQKLEIKPTRWINILSSAAFGVYLLHDDIFMSPFLWRDVFRNASYADSPLLIPYSIAVCLGVFLCATVIELLRAFLLERPFLPLLRRWADRLDRWLARVFPD